MTSVSSEGNSQITLQFSLDRDIDGAEQDVQAAINVAANVLPRTLPAPPSYSKSNPADAPVLTLAVSSQQLPLQQVNDYADSILAQKISQVPGVGLVMLNGGQRPAVRVQVDPEALAGADLTLEDVRTGTGALFVTLLAAGPYAGQTSTVSETPVAGGQQARVCVGGSVGYTVTAPSANATAPTIAPGGC